MSNVPRRFMNVCADAVGLILRALLKLYKLTLSPILGPRCRHLPSCSEYAEQAIARHGAARGCWLALKRVGRCHPWGTAGYDPVPESPVSGDRS